MDSQFCGDSKGICLLSITESIIYMGLFLYQFKILSSAWCEMKAKETQHYSFTLRNKMLTIILLIVGASLEIAFNKVTPYVIIIPTSCQLIVYGSMMKLLYEDNKYFNQSRKQFRRFVKFPFIFLVLQTLNMIMMDRMVIMNLVQILILFIFYEYLVDRACNLQVKDLKKHIDNCERLNIICNSNVNLTQHMNSKKFLEDQSNLTSSLLKQSNCHRDTPQFNLYQKNIDVDSDDDGSPDLQTTSNFEQSNYQIDKVCITLLTKEKYEISYRQLGMEQLKIISFEEMNKFMETIGIQQLDTNQILEDQNRMQYFINYLESNNHKLQIILISQMV